MAGAKAAAEFGVLLPRVQVVPSGACNDATSVCSELWSPLPQTFWCLPSPPKSTLNDSKLVLQNPLPKLCPLIFSPGCPGPWIQWHDHHPAPPLGIFQPLVLKLDCM